MIFMELWNYCPNCGKRLKPNEEFCLNCGSETLSKNNEDNYPFTPPIHNIGFFDLKIDFSPYINTNSNFKYDVCSCGYFNKIDNEWCHHCGVRRTKGGLSRFIKKTRIHKFDINDFANNTDIICECGASNSSDSEFCQMCGRRLHEEPEIDDSRLNYELKYENSIFCSCGQENSEENQFCENCGLPFDHYNHIDGMKILCVCSVLNEITADFCTECGNNLNEEIKEIICVCGTRNPLDADFCTSCQKRLNPERIIKSKIVCSCGQILDFNSEFCFNCGKNIKKIIKRKKTFSNTLESVKNAWNGV